LQLVSKALDGYDAGFELLGKIVDEILAEHLNSIQLTGHMVKGTL
jgi:hypothetical protein